MVETGYCVKCRCVRPLRDVEIVITKNNRRMQKGICGTCGTKVCKFLKMAVNQEDLEDEDAEDEDAEDEDD